MGSLLGGVGGGEVARGGAILGVGDGRLVAGLNGGADGGARLAVAAVAVVGILGAGRLRLLALGGGDAALDGEGGAVCAGDAERGGVAADLGRGYLLLQCGRGGVGGWRVLTLREWQAALCQHVGLVMGSGGDSGGGSGWGRGAEASWARAQLPNPGARYAAAAATAGAVSARAATRCKNRQRQRSGEGRGDRLGLTLARSAGSLAAERGVARLLAVGWRAVAVAVGEHEHEHVR